MHKSSTMSHVLTGNRKTVNVFSHGIRSNLYTARGKERRRIKDGEPAVHNTYCAEVRAILVSVKH